ncbi:hypothetical protein SY83_09380 [Paenibacillus swuensis]|uniref:General stress protein n=1 Tax=Paenibacillus swuensis TaxID=1178515 RepID=A0A172THG0_9BACL|nr:DUF948 domain-containing protein [Paenibacillus swuensis]ANE46450.1 hypothetical protein SY83_09380 [Paenibacillus swuensis]
MSHEKNVSLVAVSFAALAYYGIRILSKTMESLTETNHTLAEVRKDTRELSEGAKRILHTAGDISNDVKGKIRKVEPIVDTVQDVGEMLHNVTSTVKEIAATAFVGIGKGQVRSGGKGVWRKQKDLPQRKQTFITIPSST